MSSSSINVIRNKPDTTIIESGYQIYIDTTLKIDSKIYGTFCSMYDPSDEDLLIKKLSSAKDLKLTRKLESVRYLHIVNITNKDSIRGLCKLLCFHYEFQTVDSRTRLINNDRFIVIDYTPKSVAIFTKDIDIRKKLKPYEEKSLTFNSRLTGPKLEKEAGYILAKTSKYYKEIMELLHDSEKEDFQTLCTDPTNKVGNGIEQIEPSKSGNDVFIIWGEEVYVISKLNELDEEDTINYKILSEKKLDKDRKMIEVELFMKD